MIKLLLIIQIAQISAVKHRSDPIHGSLGPSKCASADNDDMNEEQRLVKKFNNYVPQTFDLDEDQHPDTQRSIEWAENSLDTKIDNPEYHRNSYWYADKSKDKSTSKEDDPF